MATAAPREAAERVQGRTSALLPRDAADPPLRGEGGPALRHGADRRLLPPLHRPGGGRRRPRGDGQGRRPARHLLSRPRPHARLRHGPQGRDGRADRPLGRLFDAARAARCTCSPRRRTSTAATASSARKCRSAPASPSPTSTAATTTSASPISATARRTRARSTRPSTWRAVEAAVIFVIENNQYAMGTALKRASSTPALYTRGEAFGIPGEAVDGMDVLAVKAAGEKATAHCRAGKGPVHPGDEHLSLPRPFHVGPGEIPHARGSAEDARGARPDRPRARPADAGRSSRPRTTSRRSTRRSRRSSTRRRSSPRTARSRPRPSSGPTSTPEGEPTWRRRS